MRDASHTGELLNWRDMVSLAGLSGPGRILAASAQVDELDESHVKLRVPSQSLVPAVIDSIRGAMTKLMGRHFQVEVVVGDVQDETILEREDRERAEEKARLIARFKSLHVVQELERRLGDLEIKDVRED